MFSTILGAILSIIGAVWFFSITMRTTQLAINSLDKIHLSVDSLAAIVAFLGGLVLIALGTTSRISFNAQKSSLEKDKNISSLLERISELETEVKDVKKSN